MGFFQKVKEVMADGPLENKEPVFFKDFSQNNPNIKALEELIPQLIGNKRKMAENELKGLKYGLEGEQNIYYELKNSFLPILCLHDLRIQYKEYVAQLDYVVICEKAMYIIECKKLSGDISINEKGEFIRHIKNYQGEMIKTEGIYSPIAQNERHLRIIIDMLKEEEGLKYKIELMKDIVVIANPKSVIDLTQAANDIKQKIIKYDQLASFLKSTLDDKKQTLLMMRSFMYKIANCLIEHHVPQVIDYNKKYACEDQEEKQVIHIKKSTLYEELQKDIQNISNPQQENTIDIAETVLYKQLKVWRYKTSQKEQIKPYCVFTNKELEELVIRKPMTNLDLSMVKGIGKVKMDKYGESILEMIRTSKNHSNEELEG